MLDSYLVLIALIAVSRESFFLHGCSPGLIELNLVIFRIHCMKILGLKSTLLVLTLYSNSLISTLYP